MLLKNAKLQCLLADMNLNLDVGYITCVGLGLRSKPIRRKIIQHLIFHDCAKTKWQKDHSILSSFCWEKFPLKSAPSLSGRDNSSSWFHIKVTILQQTHLMKASEIRHCWVSIWWLRLSAHNKSGAKAEFFKKLASFILLLWLERCHREPPLPLILLF